jgi:hypothetical protein
MFSFADLVSNTLLEAPQPALAPTSAVTGTPPNSTSNQTQNNNIKSAGLLYKELVKKADNDIKNPGTILANSGENLVTTFFISKGLQWKNKQYWGGGVQKKNLDSVAAKYVDCGCEVYKRTNLDEPLEIGFANIQDNQEALQIIQKFITDNISQYQCVDPILKNISEADNLAEIALSTFNNETVFGAVFKMLQQRAGKIKATLNKGTLQAMLTFPAQYASGRIAIPDPFEKSLVESSMYNERVLAIGVAAIEYFKYLVNMEVARITAEKRKKRDKRTVEQFNFDVLAGNLLNEFTVAGAQDSPRGTSGRYTGTNDQLRGPGGRMQSIEQKYSQSEMLKLTPFNLLDPKTWKQDSVFEKQYKNDYIAFITNGVAQSVPQKDEKGRPIVYNIETISRDRSTQAQELIKALQGITQYKRTRQSLMQKFKERLAHAGKALDAVAAFSGQSLYGGPQ